MLLNCGVGEDSWEPLGCKEIQPGHPKGNQSWIFTGRTDAEAEAPILCPPDAKDWLIGKDLDAGEDWRQEEKGMTEHEMVRWHHRSDGHEFEQVPGIGDGHRRLACYNPWSHKESDTAEQLNWTELHLESVLCKERPPQWRQGKAAPAPHNFRKPTQSNKVPAHPKIINL